jgi:hypothetical protein
MTGSRHPLKFFTVLPGFDCIFDDTRDREGCSTFFEAFFDSFPSGFVNSTAKVRPTSARTRGLVRHHLEKVTRPVKTIDIADAQSQGDYEGHGFRNHVSSGKRVWRSCRLDPASRKCLSD